MVDHRGLFGLDSGLGSSGGGVGGDGFDPAYSFGADMLQQYFQRPSGSSSAQQQQQGQQGPSPGFPGQHAFRPLSQAQQGSSATAAPGGGAPFNTLYGGSLFGPPQPPPTQRLTSPLLASMSAPAPPGAPPSMPWGPNPTAGSIGSDLFTNSAFGARPFRRIPDCMAFLTSYCSKGEECPFRHNEALRQGPREVCFSWDRLSQCEDPNCPYVHPLKSQRQTPSPGPMSSAVSALTTSGGSSSGGNSGPIPLYRRPDCMFFVKGTCSKGDRCSFRHNERAKYGPQEMCPSWERTGKCEDMNCSLLHPKPNTSSSASPKSTAVAPGAIPAVPASPTGFPAIPWIRRPDCMYYFRGSCHKGDRCAFRHNEKAKLGDQEICATWMATGTCSDQNCFHVHPKPSAAPPSGSLASSGPLSPPMINNLPATSPSPAHSFNLTSPPASPLQATLPPPTGTSLFYTGRSIMSSPNILVPQPVQAVPPPVQVPQPPTSSASPASSQVKGDLLVLAPQQKNWAALSKSTEETSVVSRTQHSSDSDVIVPTKRSSLSIDPSEESRIVKEATQILSKTQGNSMLGSQLAEKIGTRLTVLLQTTAKHFNSFMVSDSQPPRIWAIFKDTAEEVALACEIYTLLLQTPEHTMSFFALKSLAKHQSPKLLDLIKSQSSLFNVRENEGIKTVSLSSRDMSQSSSQEEIKKSADQSRAGSDNRARTVSLPTSTHVVIKPPPAENGSSSLTAVPEDIDHILEVYDISASDSEAGKAVTKFLEPYEDSLSVQIWRVDSSHSAAVFVNSAMAKQALADSKSQQGVKLRPFSQASPATKAKAAKEGWSKPVSTPVISPAGGVFTGIPIVVSITCDTPGAEIRYNLGGSGLPTQTSTFYTGPVLVDKPIRLQARAFKALLPDSAVASVIFTDGSDRPSSPATQVASSVSPATATPMVSLDLYSRSKKKDSVPQQVPSPEIPSPTAWVLQLDSVVPDEEKKSVQTSPGLGQVLSGKLRGMPLSLRRFPDLSESDLSVLHKDLEALGSIKSLSPNLISFIAATIAPDPYCAITEPLIGCSLQAVIFNPAISLTKKDLYGFALAISRGMSALHKHKVVHLNLRPSTVLLTENGVCKVCDYGFAHSCLETSLSYGPNNAAFMAPELICGTGAGPAVDSFAFGMLLWQMFTRKMPFESLTVPQVVASIAKRNERPKIPVSCSYGYGRVIERCWLSNPDERLPFDRIPSKFETLIKEDSE